MEKRRIWITILVMALIMAACGLLIRIREVQELARESIILPLYFIAWLLWLFLRSIDQVVIWGIGLIFLVLLTIYGLASAWTKKRHEISKESLAGARRPVEEPPPRTYGRVKFWKNRLDSLYSQGLANDYAIHEFRRLTQGVEAFSAHGAAYNPADDVDADLLPFFLPANQFNPEPVPALQTWRQRLAGFRQRRHAAEPVAVGETLARLCEFLEERLEIEHDDSD